MQHVETSAEAESNTNEAAAVSEKVYSLADPVNNKD